MLKNIAIKTDCGYLPSYKDGENQAMNKIFPALKNDSMTYSSVIFETIGDDTFPALRK